LKSKSSQHLIWSLSGQQGTDWIQGIAPFNSNETHQLLFEGIVGENDRSDIALGNNKNKIHKSLIVICI
jgi:hypothetical protein